MSITVSAEVAVRAAPFVSTLWASPLAALAGDPNEIEAADFAIVDAAAPPPAYDRFARLVDADGRRVGGIILPDLARHARIAAALMRDGACLETQAAVTRSFTARLSAFMTDSAAVASALHGPAEAREAFDLALRKYSEAFTTLSAVSALSSDATGDALREWNHMQHWLAGAVGHTRVPLHTTLRAERAVVTAMPAPQ
jgi:hypothetical protein